MWSPSHRGIRAGLTCVLSLLFVSIGVLAGGADRSAAGTGVPGTLPTDPIDEDSVLTSIAQVRALSPEEARRQYPVRFEATLTFYDRAAPLVLRENPAGAPEAFASGPAPHVFVQDETGGIFAWPEEWGSSVTLDPTLQVGDRVLVTGRTGPGAFVPIIEEAEIEVIGAGALPAPVSPPPSTLLSGQFDSEWIQLEGVVRRAAVMEEVLTFRMAAGREIIDVTVPTVSAVPSDLVDSRISVEGVSGTVFNDNRQLVGLYVASPDFRFVRTVEERPAPPFELPVEPIGHLHRFDPETSRNHRVNVRGTVTAHTGERTIYVQDTSGALRVELRREQEVARGQHVSIAGFPRVGTYRPVLRHAEIQTRQTGPSIRPTALSRLDSLDAHLGERVRVTGDLIATTELPTGLRLTLHGEDRVAEAHLVSEESIAEVRPGSRLSVDGVVKVPVHTGSSSGRLETDLIVPDPGAITVVEKAPWWTPRRALLVAGVLVGLVVLAGGWVFALRRRVREQTEHIRAQIEKEQTLRRKAEQAAEAKEAFLAQMSHEIRTPLSSVVGYADLIDEDQLSGRQREFLTYLKEGSKRLKDMLESVLQFARLRTGDVELDADAISLTEEVEVAADLFRQRAAEKGLDLTVELPADRSLETDLDAAALHRMLTNLLSNAVKYTDEGRVAVEAFTDDGTVGVKVRDTGPGMEAEEIERIVRPFEQASQGWNRDHEGTGLGLAITRELADELGGSLEIDSEPGEGTAVRITFPGRTTSADQDGQSYGHSA